VAAAVEMEEAVRTEEVVGVEEVVRTEEVVGMEEDAGSAGSKFEVTGGNDKVFSPGSLQTSFP
jgi:hypothetical protein